MLRELTASVPLAPSGPLGASAGSVSISTAAAARELCDLLGTYEMEGLLQAHDGVIKAIPKSAISHVSKIYIYYIIIILFIIRAWPWLIYTND